MRSNNIYRSGIERINLELSFPTGREKLTFTRDTNPAEFYERTSYTSINRRIDRLSYIREARIQVTSRMPSK